MLNPGSPFPAVTLESSKGGRTNLADVIAKGPTIVAVLPPAPDAALFDALQERYVNWLLGHFVNVYLVSAAPLDVARAWADEHGVQAPILRDDTGALAPHPGAYRVEAGTIARAAGFDALDTLV